MQIPKNTKRKVKNLSKEQLFEDTPVPKAVMTLAVPTVLSSLVMVLYSLADTYFVGILNDSVQNAAVTLAAPVLLAFNAVNNLFGVGASSMMSRALGKKDYETVSCSSALGFYSALFLAVLFSLVYTLFRGSFLTLLGAVPETEAAIETAAYLKWTVTFGAVPSILNVVMAYLVRSEGSSLHASVGTMSGCLLNILLDPLFILPWGLNMGAAGAGLATFLSNCAACGYFFLFLLVRRGKTYVCISPAKLRFRKEILGGIFTVGVPAAIQNLLNVTGMTVLNRFTSAFDADAVAAMGIAQKVSMVPVQVALGFSQGIMPLVGYNYASGNSSRMKKTVLFAAKGIIAFMTLTAAGCFFGARPLSALFMKKPAVIGYGSEFLRGFSLSMPFLCVDFLGVGVFQACGLGEKRLTFRRFTKDCAGDPRALSFERAFPAVRSCLRAAYRRERSVRGCRGRALAPDSEARKKFRGRGGKYLMRGSVRLCFASYSSA